MVSAFTKCFPIFTLYFEPILEVYEPKKTRGIEKLCPCWFPAQPSTRKKTAEAIHNTEGEADAEAEWEKRNFILRLDPIEREDLFYTGAAAYDSDYAVNTRRTTNHVIDIDNRRVSYKYILTRTNSFYISQARTINYSLSVMRSQRPYQQMRRRTISELRNRHKCPYLVYISPTNWMPAKLLNAFSRLFDMNMLKIMEFRILLLSAFFFPMGFNIPFVYSKSECAQNTCHTIWISSYM